MAFFLSPVGNEQQFDANGDPLVGGFIHTYLAGSSTPATTFTSKAGTTQQANPITLDSFGLPSSPIWLSGGISYKFVIKAADNTTIRTVDNVGGVNDVSSTAQEWISSGLVPTYINATQFSVPGDQTPILQVNRRLKNTVTAGVSYGRISVSSFSAGITTITMVNDSTPLDSGLSLVEYGFLSYSPSSVPFALYAEAGANATITSLSGLSVGGVPSGVITPSNLSQPPTLGSVVATTSGTAVDFISIPSWAKRITVILNAVSLSSISDLMIRIGPVGGVETTGYVGAVLGNGTQTTWASGGFQMTRTATANCQYSIIATLINISGSTWVFSSNGADGINGFVSNAGGTKTITGSASILRLMPLNGTDTFDTGSVNIFIE